MVQETALTGKSTTPKLLALESLRGFAALAVVLLHMRFGSVLTENRFVHNSYLMVDFFFVLSGFVIALNYTGRLGTVADIGRFQQRRFWRLYPLHLFTLLIFLVIEVLKFVFERRTGIVSNYPAFEVSDGGSFIANLFLLQGIVLNKVTFNFPSWSISTEFWTYLIFALTLGFFRLRAGFAVVAAVLAAGALIALDGGRLETDPIFAIIRCVYSFFLGVSAVALMHRLDRRPGGGAAFLLLVACIAGITFLGQTPFEIVLPLLFAATVLTVAGLQATSRLRVVLEWPCFVWLGTISYSLYMTHSIVAWSMTQILRFGLHADTGVDARGNVVLVLDQQMAAIAIVVTVLLVLLFSQLTYRYIEQPFRNGWPARKAKLQSRRTS